MIVSQKSRKTQKGFEHELNDDYRRQGCLRTKGDDTNF